MSKHHAKRRDPKMTARVLEAYGTACWLRLPGCLGIATTRDHIIPLSAGGLDTIENCRPACHRCNSRRRDKIVSGHGGARIVVVMGPPAAGKSTYVREHASSADIVLDLDELARALMPLQPDVTHTYPDYVRVAAIRARRGALEYVTRLSARVTVWIIHAVPTVEQVAEYRALRYELITIDPGRTEVERRATTQRPRHVWPFIARWYDRAPALAATATGTSTATPSTPSTTDSDTLVDASSRPW